MKPRQLVVAWAPAVVWMGMIFTLSSQSSLPSLPDAVADTVAKKGGHVTEYAVLALLGWRALRQTDQTTHPIIWAFVIAVLYAISDEWHQTFVPGRNGRPLDVLIDSTGALLGLAALHVWGRNKPGAGGARRPAPGVEASSAGVRDPEIANGT